MTPKPAKLTDRVLEDFDQVELSQPDFISVLKLIVHSARSAIREKPGQILASAFLLLMAYGFHGNLEILHKLAPAYQGPGLGLDNRPHLIPGVPWDDELISFAGGALLLVGIPLLLIRFLFHQHARDYGLGLPPKGRRALAVWTFLTLTALSLPAFYLGAQDADMRQLYPLYHRPFASTTEFALYEMTYFPFFLAIEFIFRGYLLFGLESIGAHHVRAAGGAPAPYFFGKYALLIQMLSYTAWHLGKPLPELWGTLVWGIAAGATAWAVRSIWPVVLSHWLLNIFLDYLIARP